MRSVSFRTLSLIWEGEWEEARRYLETVAPLARSMHAVHAERQVLTRLASSETVELCTASEWLEKHPPEKALALPESSWGHAGTHVVPVAEPARDTDDLALLQQLRLFQQSEQVHAFGGRSAFLERERRFHVAIRPRSP